MLTRFALDKAYSTLSPCIRAIQPSHRRSKPRLSGASVSHQPGSASLGAPKQSEFKSTSPATRGAHGTAYRTENVSILPLPQTRIAVPGSPRARLGKPGLTRFLSSHARTFDRQPTKRRYPPTKTKEVRFFLSFLPLSLYLPLFGVAGDMGFFFCFTVPTRH